MYLVYPNNIKGGDDTPVELERQFLQKGAGPSIKTLWNKEQKFIEIDITIYCNKQDFLFPIRC